MIKGIAARYARVPVAALVMLLSGGAAHADVYAAFAGDERIALTCEGVAVVDTACRIEIGQGSPGKAMPVLFTTRPTRYAHLLKRGVEKAVESSRSPFRLEAADISLLRGLALDRCHPAADHAGDVLQLCIPAGATASVVLFMRGVCDRCEFEPVILKQQAAPRLHPGTQQ